MGVKVLCNQETRVWLCWQVGGRGRWYQFGSACEVPDLPIYALNILRNRTPGESAVAFGVSVDRDTRVPDRLGWPDFEQLVNTQKGSGLTAEGQEELRRRTLDP